MNIVHVNNCDLPGRRFNGHDLQLSLNRLGHKAYQFVVEKYGCEPTTISLVETVFGEERRIFGSILENLKYQLSMINLIQPFGKSLFVHPNFREADIVHYHLIHNDVISLLDFPNLTNLKPSVWTVHDPWIVTGHCIHPHECVGWKNGCLNCMRFDEMPFPMKSDKASQMWNIKKQVYKEMDVDIVVASQFMEEYIKKSPLTANFKHIHKIPFGIEVDSFSKANKKKARKRWGISDKSFVIAFRAESNEIKGLKYIIEMLNKLTTYISITVLTVGGEALPLNLTEKYKVVELGWQNDLTVLYDFYAASDVFLMPSLAESFGLMAIEAMAAGCPVVVFEETVLQEITYAPECGIAVPYKNSNMLKITVERLMKNPDECRWRGEKGKELAQKYYKYDDYVNAHIALYQEILERKRISK